MSVKSVYYKGKYIYYADYRDCKTEDEMLQTLEEFSNTLKALPTRVPILNNFEGSSITKEFMSRLKTLGKEADNKMSKISAIGVKGLKNIFIQAYNNFTGQNVMVFLTETEAMEWLTK